MALRFQRLHNRDWVKCPLQPLSPVFAYSQEKFRWLREPNGDKTCEFCGSWHPDEFIDFVNQVIATDGECGTIDLNDSKDKIYINRKNVHNAGEGAIKFKLAHLSPEYHSKFISNINQALKISYIKFTAKMGSR